MVMSRPEGLENWTDTAASAEGEAKLPVMLTMAGWLSIPITLAKSPIWNREGEVGTKVQSRGSREPGRWRVCGRRRWTRTHRGGEEEEEEKKKNGQLGEGESAETAVVVSLVVEKGAIGPGGK